MVSIRIAQKNGAPKGHACYEFRVKDNGIGMSEKFQAHIFEQFAREESATDTCLNVSTMLSKIGMRPEWTISGKEAVIHTKYAVEQGDRFSVFIIDWLIPDMNGIEVVRRIRKLIGDDCPIIILTAYDWADIEDEARTAGVTAFCENRSSPPSCVAFWPNRSMGRLPASCPSQSPSTSRERISCWWKTTSSTVRLQSRSSRARALWWIPPKTARLPFR